MSWSLNMRDGFYWSEKIIPYEKDDRPLSGVCRLWLVCGLYEGKCSCFETINTIKIIFPFCLFLLLTQLFLILSLEK